MRILITGGAGFIGSHLADVCIAGGHDVTCLDDLSTGRLENVEQHVGNPRFTLSRGTILDGTTVDRLVAGADHVYHLGAAVGVKLIFERPLRTIETNVLGSETVLRAAVRHKRKTFIASTSEVYGKNTSGQVTRFRESDDITLGSSIRWCYATSKAIDEHLARAYYLEHGLEVVIGRFFNTVGPRQRGAYGMVVPRLVRQALSGGPITVYGDGAQVRSFTWVGDAVRAAIDLMACPSAIGQTFNIGSVEAVTIRELAHRIRDIANPDAEIQYIPYEQIYGPGFEDIRYRVPDISKLQAAIDYRPTKRLDDILRHMVEDTIRGGTD